MRYKKIIITGSLILMTAFGSACGSSDDGKNMPEKAENVQSEVRVREDKPEAIEPEADTDNREEKNSMVKKRLMKSGKTWKIATCC